MKRAYILLPIFIVLIGSGAYFYFHWQYAGLSKWSFVPSNSIMVFQPTNYPQLLSGDEDRKILTNLKSLPELQEVGQSLQILDSAFENTFDLETVLSTEDLLISLHQGASSSLAKLYILEVSKLKHHDFLAGVASYLEDELGFTKSERVYEGHQITEYKKEDEQLAYIFFRNYLVFSFSSFLVDDAIRSMESRKQNPYTRNVSIQSEGELALLDEGRLFVNMKELKNWVNHFIDPIGLDMNNLQWLTDLMYLDVRIDHDEIDLSGFSYIDTAEVNYLSSFVGVKGTGFEMKNVIPNHSSAVVHVSFEDVTQWHNGLKNFWRKHQPSQLTKIGEIENRYDFKVKKIYDFVDDEVGFFLLESKKNLDREKIFCIKHKDIIRAENYFEDLTNLTRPDTVDYRERYAGRLIGEVLLDELPGRLFGYPFTGFETSYYYIDEDFIFIGNSQHALEILIDDIDSENTWRKSVKTNSFLESTNDDANLSLYVRSSGFWNLLMTTLNQEWGEYVMEHKPVLNQVQYGVIQFTGVDNKFYTNLTLQHPGKLIENPKPKDFLEVARVDFQSSLISKPFAVRNHHDKSLEILVQDSLFSLNLISSDNQPILKIPLKGKLTSPIYQIDYYKNGKLQYLFSTQDKVHIVDRKGNYIPGYPQKVKNSEDISFISLIDYDNSRNYRIMISTQKGYHYLTDKAGKRLKGWNPMKLKGDPAMSFRHLRVRTRDYMITLQNDGLAYAFNRRGEIRDNFPIDLKSSVSSPLHIEKGASQKTTEIISVTNNGELIVFNPLGEVVRKGQLLKEETNENFQLISSSNGRDFLVVRNRLGSVEVFGEQLEKLFDIASVSEDLMYQYYSFGEGNRIFILIDVEKERISLYHLDGRTLHRGPLESKEQIAMLFHESKDQYELFVSSGQTFKRLGLNR